MVMVRKTIDVDLNLDEFEITELIDELEKQGYIILDKSYQVTPDDLKDKIYMLKEDFLNWYQLGMSNERFEKTLKQFFLDTIDEYIS